MMVKESLAMDNLIDLETRPDCAVIGVVSPMVTACDAFVRVRGASGSLKFSTLPTEK